MRPRTSETRRRRRSRGWLALGALAMAWWAAGVAAQKPAPAPAAVPAPAPAPDAGPKVTIRLVTDHETDTLVSDRERLEPVSETVFDQRGTRTVTLGQRAELWVRNAGVDQRFWFERYYQGKYIGRKAEIEIGAAELGVGEHVIHPGAHRFTLDEAGKLASADPDIRIADRTVSLRLYQVDVFAVDGARSGPPEFRLVARPLGVFALDAAVKLAADALPDATKAVNDLPQYLAPPPPPAAGAKPPAAPAPAPKPRALPELVNLLSHADRFYPLTVWLPANQVGQGYALYPSWQAFHVAPGGALQLAGGGAPAVAGIAATDGAIVIPHRTYGGRVETRSNLTAALCDTPAVGSFTFGATLAPIRYRAGFRDTLNDFFLPLDNDLARRSHKFFLADNSQEDPGAVRLFVLEWDQPVFVRGQEATVGLRLLETAGKERFAGATVQVDYSRYQPGDPAGRTWEPLSVTGWQNGRERGDLRFRAPDVPFCFVVLRVGLRSAGASGWSPLHGEIAACVVEPGQTGTASVIAPKGRTAFVAGEEITLDLCLRSTAKRAGGDFRVELRGPDGISETLTGRDPGDPWYVATLRLPAEHTRRLPPGAYAVALRDPPAGLAAVPYAFTLTGRDPVSLYHVVKTSKYTRPMNDLVTSHFGGGTPPVDLERAMATLAELGYNRVDLMTYITNHHVRPNTWRETLAATDARLPAPAAVYTPIPRDQLLNGAVRAGLQFADVMVSYNDFHLPRQIEPYIRTCERWLARDVQSMRHSPAFDGMMLYDEMYQGAVTGIVKTHQKLFASIRGQLAEQELGQTPAKIEAAINKYISRPRSQREPETLALYLKYKFWEQHGWGDWANRMVAVGKDLAPRARFGTYHRTWMGPGTSDDIYNGYAPDLFKNLDIISHVHYADNSTCWVHIPMLASLLRSGVGKTLYINLPITHEVRTNWDGQYQRHMAFALLAQGADGIAMWGLPHSFEDGPNPGTVVGLETTRQLNRDVLQPFGELITRSTDGYGKVGIVSTFNEQALSSFKEIGIGHQTEEIWTACWRLGYPATFLREEQFAKPLTGFQVIFVPGVRFDGELDETVLAGLRQALAGGTKVVVEAGSTLELPGLIRLDDWPLTDFFLGVYFPTWLDDELNKIYEKSQRSTDYLRRKFAEWGVTPAGRGPFQVGPSWRDAGGIHYLVMANFNDPPYQHTVKQQMAQPVRLPLQVPASHGRVAYDLLTGKELPLAPAADGAEWGLTLDMTRVPGALVAFLPEAVGGLRVYHAAAADAGTVRVRAELLGAAGGVIAGRFPVRVTFSGGAGGERTFHRALGGELSASFDVPAGAAATPVTMTVREALSGRAVSVRLAGAANAPALAWVSADATSVPYPAEVTRFLQTRNEILVVPAGKLPELAPVAAELVAALKQQGHAAKLADERTVYHFPAGDKEAEDPYMDGYHSWRLGQEVIPPATIVEAPVILLGGRESSFLVQVLADNGYLTFPPVGGPGQRVRPGLQVAHRGLSWQYDTLCLLANDAASARLAVKALLAPAATAAAPAVPGWGAEQATTTNEPPAPAAPPAATVGNNELITDVQFDAAGNLYVTTWGHAKNLYALAPDGKARFSRYLPEMGVNRLIVAPDRLLAYTAAGARLYQLTLDGKPLAQARINPDPGDTYDDSYSLSYASFDYVPARKLLLHNLGDRMRVLSDQFAVQAEWPGEAFEDKDVGDEVLRRRLHGFALSPDQTRLAQLESSFYYTKSGHEDVEVFDAHLVLRDLTGKLLGEFRNVDNGTKVTARVTWPAGAPGPVVFVKGERWRFNEKLEQLGTERWAGGLFGFGGDRRLVADGHALYFHGGTADQPPMRFGPLARLPTYAALSGDARHVALLDEERRLLVYATADGKLAGQATVPELGAVLRFTPDHQRLILGGSRGTVQCYDLAGKLVWQTWLGQFNDGLGQDLPLVDASFPDRTDQLWPATDDQPGELEALVRLGDNRLANGDMEADTGWQGPPVTYAAPGHAGKRSLKVGTPAVSQATTEYLGRHLTWVLECFYRAADPARGGTLLAGLRTESAAPDAVARRFRADAQWRFARLVIKSGEECRRVEVGFSAVAGGGEVLVDDVTLRQLRFPSINPLLYEPLYRAEPAVLENPFYSSKYDPLGSRREEAPNRVMIPPIRNGALNLVEAAFLQNGRLNDVGSKWYIQPFGEQPTVSLGLREPRWVSLVAVYFNTRDEANVTPHFDLFVTDQATNKVVRVAAVRHNRQLFRLVKFPPVRTSVVTLKFVNSLARLRTITELELYGPLSGREGEPGFLDAEGQNTYMGDFSRVDRRVKPFIPTFGPPVVQRYGHGDTDLLWQAPMGQVLADADRFYIARACGLNETYTLAEPTKAAAHGRAGGIGYSAMGALYGGLLLRPGNDGKLYCISPDSGSELWSVALGARLFGCPVAIGADVYVANETGTIYQLDLANGSIMREARLSGGVYGALATDGTFLYFVTADGKLQKYRARDLAPVWQVPIAPDSDGTPAVDQGVVYLADQQGTALAVRADNATVVWRRELGEEFTRCPVVGPKHILFGCRGGKLAALDRASGAERWARQTKSRFQYEPLLLDDKVVFADGAALLAADLATGATEPLQWLGADRGEKDVKPHQLSLGEDPIAPFSYYKGRIFAVPRSGDAGHTSPYSNHPWHVIGGYFHVLSALPPPLPAKEKK